jgi:phosphonate transport system permease protein
MTGPHASVGGKTLSGMALSRMAFPANWPVRLIVAAFILYTLYVTSILDVSLARFISGMGHAAKLFDRMFPPNMAADKLALITEGMIESVQIAILSTFFGTLLSLPLGLAAARNLVPLWLASGARILIAICRSFHPIIISILFVKAVGFGALAGMLALVISSMGFVAKLFAEILEEISLKQIEAVRATGASFANVLIFAVVPQVMGRFIGLSVYQFDSNLRNSTMVGIVGGGGIGAALFTAYQRFDYDVVLTILLIIIALIILCEAVSSRIRKITQ